MAAPRGRVRTSDVFGLLFFHVYDSKKARVLFWERTGTVIFTSMFSMTSRAHPCALAPDCEALSKNHNDVKKNCAKHIRRPDTHGMALF